MDQDLLHEDVSALASRLGMIDESADEFEQAWTPAAKTLIERFIARSKPSLRPALSVELVKLELELRANRGESADLAEYFVRLPQLIAPTGWPDDELVEYSERLPRKRGEIGYPTTTWEDSSGFKVVQRRSVSLRPTTYDVIDRRSAGGQAGTQSPALLTVYPPMVKAQVNEVTRLIQAWEVVESACMPRVREFGSLGGCFYVLQDPPSGPSLASLAAERKFDWREAVRLTGEAASAVASLHANGLSHGLLSPHAITALPDGKVQLLGLPTVEGHFRSSPAPTDPRLDWLCPEDAWNFPKTEQKAADQFALGAILYHLLTGQALYVAPDTKQTLAKALACSLDEKPLAARRVPPRIREVCKKALQRNPQLRFPSVEAMLQELVEATKKSWAANWMGWLGRS